MTYNHTGTQFFETKPTSSLLTLMETAKSMVREAIPIKCMEGKLFLTLTTWSGGDWKRIEHKNALKT